MNPTLVQLSLKPSARRDFLRDQAAAALTAEVKAERNRSPRAAQVCAWCAAVETGVMVILPKRSARQCIEHEALNVEYSRRLARLPFDASRSQYDALFADTYRRGLQVATRKNGVDFEPPQAM